jgi:hypothetical protein
MKASALLEWFSQAHRFLTCTSCARRAPRDPAPPLSPVLPPILATLQSGNRSAGTAQSAARWY